MSSCFGGVSDRAGASIPEAVEIGWLMPKEHALVNPRA
jgi:hypothetical protein